jgi:hypothetical protein
VEAIARHVIKLFNADLGPLGDASWSCSLEGRCGLVTGTQGRRTNYLSIGDRLKSERRWPVGRRSVNGGTLCDVARVDRRPSRQPGSETRRCREGMGPPFGITAAGQRLCICQCRSRGEPRVRQHPEGTADPVVVELRVPRGYRRGLGSVPPWRRGPAGSEPCRPNSTVRRPARTVAPLLIR